MIEKFELTGLADRLPGQLPVGSSKELHWRGSWRMSRMSFCWMSHFRIGRIFKRPASAGTDRDAEGL